MDDYIGIMQKHENMCRALLVKAEEERLKHDGKHTQAECVYLQEAARIRGEMARLSQGAAKQSNLDEKRDLDYKIHRIRMELSAKKAKPAKEDPADNDLPEEDKNEPETVQEDNTVDEKTVAKWYVKDTSHGFEDVAGMSETVAQLKSCIASTKHAKLRSYFKMSNTHGFLLFGPPGCGKTYIATAFAHELLQKDYKYMSLVGADILSKYVGEAENTVKRLFEEARKNAPCIVFIDEIDSICKNRSQEGLPEYASSITTAFLNGFNSIVDRPTGEDGKDQTIIFICATNYPNLVDDAMVDRMKLIRIPLPDTESRTDAFRHKLGSIAQLGEDLTFEEMAEATEKYNRRDINRLVEIMFEDQLKKAEMLEDVDIIEEFQNGTRRLTRADFQQALERSIPSPKDNILREQAEWEARLQKAQADKG